MLVTPRVIVIAIVRVTPVTNCDCGGGARRQKRGAQTEGNSNESGINAEGLKRGS